MWADTEVNERDRTIVSNIFSVFVLHTLAALLIYRTCWNFSLNKHNEEVCQNFLIVLLFMDYGQCYRKPHELGVEIWVYFMTKTLSRAEHDRLDLLYFFSELLYFCKTPLKTFKLSFCTTAFALQIWQNKNKITSSKHFLFEGRQNKIQIWLFFL